MKSWFLFVGVNFRNIMWSEGIQKKTNSTLFPLKQTFEFLI